MSLPADAVSRRPGAPAQAAPYLAGPPAPAGPPPRLSRGDLVWRYGLTILDWVVGAVTTVALAITHWPGRHLGSIPTWPAWRCVAVGLLPFVCGVPAILLLRLRRRYPVRIAAVEILLSTVDSSSAVAADWAFISMATRRRPREVIPLAVFLVLSRFGGLVWNNSVDISLGTGPLAVISTLVGGIGEVALLIAIGFYVGARRALVSNLQDEVRTTQLNQELQVLRGQAEERNRIAREMHDVLAHRISLVSMHAGILAYRDDLSAEQEREIAQTIQENASASLTELRAVLGDLRSPLLESGGPVPPEKPQPTLSDVPDLVADARAAGLKVEISNSVEHPELMPSQVGRHAYRIVQEALTNARKHATGAVVHLAMSGAPGQGLAITVRNPLRPGTPPLVPGSGVGLVGMNERARTVGGTVDARQLDGWFVVSAWLPW